MKSENILQDSPFATWWGQLSQVQRDEWWPLFAKIKPLFEYAYELGRGDIRTELEAR